MSEKKGLIIVNTGTGKGKTTAALGMGFRAWGQGMKVLVLQFIKGGWKYGELRAAEKLAPNFIMKQMGEGFIKGSSDDDMAHHRRAAQEALTAAKAEVKSGQWDMIILDEINYALGYGLVPLQEVLDIIDGKPPMLHLVLTGRNAAPEVIDRADLVTEMKEIKHPYQRGIDAQMGVEY